MTVPETTLSDTGIAFSTTAVASDSSNSLLFLKPPPGSEIPRSASVSSALPRPRPQVERSANRKLWRVILLLRNELGGLTSKVNEEQVKNNCKQL